MKEKLYYTLAEVAERFCVSPNTVRAWIDSHDLIALEIGRTVRIKRDDLLAFEEAQRTVRSRATTSVDESVIHALSLTMRSALAAAGIPQQWIKPTLPKQLARLAVQGLRMHEAAIAEKKAAQ